MKILQEAPLIAALYARVSTERQEDEETIEVQINEIKERAKQDGYVIPDANIFLDEGWSGALLERPGLDEMRKAAREKKFKILYVYDRGRLSRIYHRQRVITDDLEELDIQVISLHGKEAETDLERVFQAMEGVFHEYERAKIADRFRIAKIQRAKSGRLINGHALYGYKILRKPSELRSKQERKYAIDEEQAHIVRQIYKWFVRERVSLRKIIERLYELGVKPPKAKQDYWVKESIMRILKCETYSKGKIYFNKSQAIVPRKRLSKEKYIKTKKSSRAVREKKEWIAYKVPSIIPDDGTFERAQELLKYNQQHAKKNRKHPYLLTGKIYCGCGYKRIGDGRQIGHCYYRCVQRIHKHPYPSECTLPGVNVKALDGALWKKVKKMITEPKQLQKYAELRIRSQFKEEESKQKMEQVQSLIDQCEEELKRYAHIYGKGELEFEHYKNMTAEVKRREQGLLQQQSNLEKLAAIRPDKPEAIKALCEEATKAINKATLANKKKFVHHIIQKVVVHRKEVEITMHVPVKSPLLCELTEKVEQYATSRNCRSTKCGKVHAVQCTHKAGC